jgi:PKD repeat protein
MLHRKIFGLFLVACLVTSLTAQSSAQSLRSGGCFSGTDGTCAWSNPDDPDWVFERFTYAMGYAECAGSIAEWRAKSPDCQLVLYVSGTDLPPYKSYTSNSYNMGKKSTWIRDRLVELGEPEESAYLHFYDNTYLRGWNGSSYDTLLIPGTYSLSVSAADSVSRVPNSYVSALFVSDNTYEYPTRLSPNFSSPQLRLAYKEYLTQIFDEQAPTHWPEATGTWDGIHFDNYSPYGMVGSALCSGGHVVESANEQGEMLVFASSNYRDWTWDLMKTFGREVRDTLQVADLWSTNGKKKTLAYNIGISHTDDYLDPEISGADALNVEFGFEPVYCNNYSYFRLENLFSRDSIAVANGVTFFWTSVPRTTYGNGSTTKREAIYNNLCFYYVARSDSTWFYARPDPGYAYAAFLNPAFDTLAWVPAMEHDLGNPVGHYELLATGSSPDQAGAVYKIWSREYELGKVLIRPRDGFDAKWGATSQAIEADLGGAYQKLQPDGSLGSETTNIALRGGEGAILLPASGTGYLDFAASPTVGCAPLDVEFSVETSHTVIAYNWDFGDGGTSDEAAPTYQYGAPGSYSVSLTVITPEGQQSTTHPNFVAVCAPATAAFSASATSGTAPLVVEFTDQSSGNPVDWQWDFGDGAGSAATNPSHTFAAAGDYTVQLTVAAECCSEASSDAQTIHVEPLDSSSLYAQDDTLYYGATYGGLEGGYSSDDRYQVIVEAETKGKPSRRTSHAEHRWQFSKPATGPAILTVEGCRSQNFDGDDFVFEYSADNQSFVPLLTIASGAELVTTAVLPSVAAGTIFIRARDTNGASGNMSEDTLYVDHLFIEMSDEPQVFDTVSISHVALTRTKGKNNKDFATAQVIVQDQWGAPASGVLIEGQFSGPTQESASALTDGNGQATVSSKDVRNPIEPWCFQVDDLILASAIYDPARDLMISACETNAAKVSSLPLAFDLQQNSPNPFNPATTIEFSIPQDGDIRLVVYNSLGQLVSILIDQPLTAGQHQVNWDGTDTHDRPAASGMYFYRLTAADLAVTRKMLLLK